MALLDGVAVGMEAAHLLFLDMVGFTRHSLAEQLQALAQFQRALRQSPAFLRAAEQKDVLCLPTGDGAALTFFHNPVAPVRCALDVSRALSDSSISLRMGLHSGLVCRVPDVNGRENVSGEGINTAQRVMDCGDAGHILASDTVAVMLLQLVGWGKYVRDWGECEVKHGQKVHLYGLSFEGIGNPKPPPRLEQTMNTHMDAWERDIMETSPNQRRQKIRVPPQILRSDALPFTFEAVSGVSFLEAPDVLDIVDTVYDTTTGIFDRLLGLD